MFGLSVDADVPLPGLVRTTRPAGTERSLRIDTRDPAALDERRLGERVCEWRDEARRTTLAIDRTDDAFRFIVAGVGLYELALDGTRVTSVPVPAAGWPWRRYMIGQLLPFAAVLQGLEVFHASAVEIAGAAVAISGASGLGKSTLALELHRQGAGFLTDDVLAVDLSRGIVRAHRGAGMAKVRRVGAKGLVEVRRAVAGRAEPVPLQTFCLLQPSDDGTLTVAEAPAEARHLLGSTFNLVVTAPERLGAQLDVCAAVARQARVVRVGVPPVATPQVAAELRDLLAAAPAIA